MKRRGFTLIELLLAAVIMTVMLASLYGIYHTATRMRERVWNDIQTSVPVDEVIRVMRTDLGATIGPGEVLARPFMGLSQQDGAARRDTLDFGAAVGRLNDDEPWADLVEVGYSLIEPEDGNLDTGMDLARTLTRNLLAQTVMADEPQRLLHNVEALQFQYWDGEYWQDSWDSTALENKLPSAIRVRVEFAEIKDKPARSPIEMVCRTVCDNTTESTTTSATQGSGS